MIKKVIGASFALAMGTAAYASCDVEGRISVLSNAGFIDTSFKQEFEACHSDSFKSTWKANPDHKSEIVKAFDAKKGPYDVSFVANGSINEVQSKGLLYPLDDLVAKYKDKYKITENQLVRIDGKIYSIAFMVNAQHFFYRKDLFEKHDIPVPTTYDEILAAAEILEKEESIDFPYGAAFKSGWNLAQEFNNIYLGHEGTYFKPGTFEPAIRNGKAMKSLELMAKLKAHMSPNALVLDSGSVQQMARNGKIAMAVLWGTRAEGMDDASKSSVVGKFEFTSAPKISKDSDVVASTVFWDGFVIPKNAQADREQTFKNVMYLYSPEMVKKYNDKVVWVMDGYEVNRYAKGVIETFENDAPQFPLTPAYSVMHGIFGKEIGNYLTGKKSAEQVLEDVEAEYRKVAKEKGIL